MLQPWGRKELDTTERMNLNELLKKEHQSPFYLHQFFSAEPSLWSNSHILT